MHADLRRRLNGLIGVPADFRRLLNKPIEEPDDSVRRLNGLIEVPADSVRQSVKSTGVLPILSGSPLNLRGG